MITTKAPQKALLFYDIVLLKRDKEEEITKYMKEN